MITLEEYKNYLLNYYRYSIDSTKEKFKEREKFLKLFYPDKLLEQIIQNTYAFVQDIFNCDTLKNGYCEFALLDDTSFGIDLIITGGGYSDYI